MIETFSSTLWQSISESQVIVYFDLHGKETAIDTVICIGYFSVTFFVWI